MAHHDLPAGRRAVPGDAETHRLQLVEAIDVEQTLRGLGFSVERLAAYGSLSLPEGLVGFLARKRG